MDTMNLSDILGLTQEEINAMTFEEIEALLASIGELASSEDRNLDLGIEPDPDTDPEELADAVIEIIEDVDLGDEEITVLEEVVDELIDARARRKKRSKRNTGTQRRSRASSRLDAAQTNGRTIRTFGSPSRSTQPEDPFKSRHYRSAFVKHLARRDAEMTSAEKRAFAHTTGMTNAPVPTTMLNEIWDTITQEHSILDDVLILQTGTAIEIPIHKSIDAGKAKKVAEATANDDEENTFIKINLAGHDFSKHINISYAMAKMSIPALDSYLIKELSDQMGEAMSDDAIETIIAGINAANKVTATGQVKYTDITKLYALLKQAKRKVVYVNNFTLFDQIASIVDGNDRPIFQQSMQPDVEGVMIGAEIHVEESVGDGKILVGNPDKVPYNMIQDILIENDKNITNHVYTYAAYARGECALANDKSFALLTVGS